MLDKTWHYSLPHYPAHLLDFSREGVSFSVFSSNAKLGVFFISWLALVTDGGEKPVF